MWHVGCRFREWECAPSSPTLDLKQLISTDTIFTLSPAHSKRIKHGYHLVQTDSSISNRGQVNTGSHRFRQREVDSHVFIWETGRAHRNEHTPHQDTSTLVQDYLFSHSESIIKNQTPISSQHRGGKGTDHCGHQGHSSAEWTAIRRGRRWRRKDWPFAKPKHNIREIHPHDPKEKGASVNHRQVPETHTKKERERILTRELPHTTPHCTPCA